MSKDDLEFFRRLKGFQPVLNSIDLLKGIELRKLGLTKQNATVKEDLELFAEEQLIKKKDFDEMRCEMPGQPRSTFLMVFSPDGSRVASTHGNHNIYITDLRSGKHIRTLVGHPRTPWCIAFHPTSNQIVASGCLGGQVRIWDLSGGSEVWTAENQTVIASLAFHPSDRVLVIATYNEVYFWDWSRPEPFAHVATSNAKEKVRYVAFDSLGHKLITGIANSPQTRWERVRAPVPIAHQGPGVNLCHSYRRRITQRLQNPPAPENTTASSTPRDALSSVPERERRITVCYRNLVREYEQLVHRYLQLYRPPIMIDRGTDPMEPNNSSQNQTIDLTRPPPEYPGPSTSGQNTSASQQEPDSRREPEITQNASEPQSNSNSGGNSTLRPENSTIRSQSLLTPSKIFSVLSKPSVLIQGTQTSESRKHKSEQSGSELPHEKRFKSSSSDTKDDGPSTSDTASNDRTATTSDAVEVESPPVPQTSLRVEENPSNSNAEMKTSPGPSGFINSLQQPGGSSAFTEPIKSRPSKEKRQRSSEEPKKDKDQSKGASSNTKTFVAEAKNSQTPSNESSPSKTRASDVSQKPPNSPEQPREKRFKSSDSTDSQTEEGHSSNSARTSPPTRSSFTLTPPETGYVAGSNRIKPPPSYSSATSGLNTAHVQRSGGFRIRIPLDRERSNAVSSSDAVNTGGSDNPQPSSSTGTSSTGRRDLPNKVGDLLLDIRRTAEEEVRNRILPIIRSVPPNDRPELIRLFENSREHVRLRFRQMYPMFVRKTNRRIINLADTSSDNSSSDEEPPNSSNNRHVRRNSEPASSAGLTNPTRASGPVLPTVSSTNASGSHPNVSTGTGTTGNNSGTVRNFNTELEQLVTSLLNEIERNEGENNRRNITSNSNETTQTTRTNNTSNSNSADQNRQVEESADIRRPLTLHSLSNQSNSQQTRREPSSIEDSSSPSAPGSNASTPQTSDNTTFTYLRSSSSDLYNSYLPRRRRLFPCRISAFMPTRVNCFRPPPRLRRSSHMFRGRQGASNNIFTPYSSTFDLDQLINFSERDTSEDESTQQPLDLSNHPNPDNPELDNVYSNIRLGNVYSNIIQDLESSLNDVIRMRASNRPGETSDMLGSFSERLESIMNQSDTILRNLSNSMDILSTAAAEPSRPQLSEPRLVRFDQDFYVRDQRNDSSLQETNRDNTINLSDIFNAVAADHTYPRNPDLARQSTQGDGLSPFMTSIHMTISHIQRQARLLRQQVESIERIDRAMLEVAQLQLIRHLNVDLLRYLRTPNGESRSTGMTSMRQMMAGTRISDSSPYESPAEDLQPNQDPNPSTSSASSSTSNTGGVSSSSNGGHWNQPSRPRSSHRKTYPPGKIHRMSRHSRKPPIFHFFSRRYTNRNERNSRQAPPSRLASRMQHEPSTSSSRQESHPNYTYINTYTLTSMATRLENLLTEQMRVFTTLQARPPPSLPSNRSSSMVDLGEHILASRLHGCVVRVNRLWDNQSVRSDSSTAVTQDGESRYGARHTLSTIIESMSRYFEEVGSSNIPQSIKIQIHSVLVMALLLTELLLLVIVDSIPPPSGINLIPERAFLTSRIDHMCNQMLQSRNFNLSHQLTRSLRLMKLTMRHAHRLGQSYHARRNAMLPRNNLERRQLLGSINRCLRSIHRRRQPIEVQTQESTTEEPSTSHQDSPETPENPEQTTSEQSPASTNIHEWYSTLIDVLSLYRLNRTNRSSNSGNSGDSNTGLNRSSNTEPDPTTEQTPNQTTEPNTEQPSEPPVIPPSPDNVNRDTSDPTQTSTSIQSPRPLREPNQTPAVPSNDSSENSRDPIRRRFYHALSGFSRELSQRIRDTHEPNTQQEASGETNSSHNLDINYRHPNESTRDAQQEQDRVSNREPILDSNREPIQDSNREPIRDSNREPTRDSNRELARDSNREPTPDSNREPTRDSNRETTRDSNRDPTRDSNREPTRQRVQYPYPFLTWNRERGANRDTNSGSPWRGGDSSEGRVNRLFNNLRNTVVQHINWANDNTDGDDTDDTESYHSTNSPTSQNGNVHRPGTGPASTIPFLNVPSVQVNDVPVPVSEPLNFSHRLMNRRQIFAERVNELRSNPNIGLFRPRFLHPLYASVNPFDADLDDPQREQNYDSDMITTVTPNHRIQAWDVSDWNVPAISNALKNVVVGECKIHNDASVDVAKDGTILVTLLPSGGYLNVTNRLGVYSLRWETLGQCLYTTSFEQNAVSVSLSPLSRHLVVGLTHRIITSERWVMARVFKIPKDVPGDRLPVLRELEQSRDSRINCIRWLPVSGQGLIYATNTGQLVILS